MPCARIATYCTLFGSWTVDSYSILVLFEGVIPLLEDVMGSIFTPRPVLARGANAFILSLLLSGAAVSPGGAQTKVSFSVATEIGAFSQSIATAASDDAAIADYVAEHATLSK